MLHLFMGSTDARKESDDYRLREAYRELRAGLDTDGMLETNTSRFEPRGLTAEVLVQHLSTLPFMGAVRLVVVEGLLLAAGGARGTAERWQPLVDFLPSAPPSSHLVLIEPLPDREDRLAVARSPLLKALRAVPDGDVREFAELSLGRGGRNAVPNEVARWARERAAARGIPFEPAAAEALSQLLGSDLWALASEIEKLSSYAGGRPVTPADVALLTPASRDADIFALVDAVAEGRASEALRLARQMHDEGSRSNGEIQGIVVRHLRNLVRAEELARVGASDAEVGEATGARHPFAREKLLRQAQTAGRDRVAAALRAVAVSDHAVKTGQLDEGLALELLLTELAATLGPVGQPRGSGPRVAGSRR